VEAFLSHNHADKDTAKRLGAQLTLAGAYVWFDDWEVHAGDSISRKVDDALASVDTLVLLWSANADRSKWVRAELETAITRSLDGGDDVRVIPVRLDATALPTLLRRVKWVDFMDNDIARAVNEIMGFTTDQQRLIAIQQTLDESGIDVRYFEGYGPAVCCPRCGAGVDRLSGWSAIDHDRDDTYAGLHCENCGFEDGGEIG
jgi:hypothetical protein